MSIEYQVKVQTLEKQVEQLKQELIVVFKHLENLQSELSKVLMTPKRASVNGK